MPPLLRTPVYQREEPTIPSLRSNKTTEPLFWQKEIVVKGMGESQAEQEENGQLLYFLLLAGRGVILEFLPF